MLTFMLENKLVKIFKLKNPLTFHSVRWHAATLNADGFFFTIASFRWSTVRLFSISTENGLNSSIMQQESLIRVGARLFYSCPLAWWFVLWRSCSAEVDRENEYENPQVVLICMCSPGEQPLSTQDSTCTSQMTCSCEKIHNRVP